MIHKSIFYQELRLQKTSFFIWLSVVLAFSLVIMAFFPSMQDIAMDMQGLMDSLPEALRKGLGMDSQMLSEPLSFYKVYYGTYILLIMAIFSFAIGARLFSQEEANKSIEFLLSRPVTRLSVAFSKFAAGLVLYLGLAYLQASINLFAMYLFAGSDFSLARYIILHVHGVSALFICFSLGVLLGGYLHPKRSFMGIAVGFVFVMYFLNAFSHVTEASGFLAYFSLFYYADLDLSNPEYTLSIPLLFFSFLLGTSLLYFALARFESKDFLYL